MIYIVVKFGDRRILIAKPTSYWSLVELVEREFVLEPGCILVAKMKCPWDRYPELELDPSAYSIVSNGTELCFELASDTNDDREDGESLVGETYEPSNSGWNQASSGLSSHNRKATTSNSPMSYNLSVAAHPAYNAWSADVTPKPQGRVRTVSVAPYQLCLWCIITNLAVFEG
jgi:hypothetical protein